MRTRGHRRLWAAVYGVCLFLAGTAVSPAPAPGAAGTGDPLDLFAELMPVFGHPRCVNCHGGVDPFNEYAGPPQVEHGGDVVGDPKLPAMDRVNDCGGCHNATKEIENKWFLATLNGPQLNWLGKSTKDVCNLQAHEVQLMKKKTPTWMQHLHEDTLITQAFVGLAGGAREKDPPDPPPMKRPAFLKAAQEWVDAGAGCSTWVGTITQTETFSSNYGFPMAGSTATTTVNESANRTYIVSRDAGSTTADIKMSGHRVQTTVDIPNCQARIVINDDWINDGSYDRTDIAVSFRIAADGSSRIHFRGPPEITKGKNNVITSSTCGGLPDVPPSTTDLEWNPWEFNIRCPASPPINTARGESIDCDLFDAENSPRLKGRMTRVIQDGWDGFDRQSWLSDSPVGANRSDDGSSLPVTVVTEWDFELD